MTSGKAYSQVQSALRAELQRHFGRIHEIESGLGRSDGYLSKFCKGNISIPLETLLRALELLGINAGQFFGQALGATVRPIDLLHPVGQLPEDRAFERLTATTDALAAQVPPGQKASQHFPVDIVDPEHARSHEWIEDMALSSPAEQRRRLRKTERYRSAPFVLAYLAFIERYRGDHPREAMKLLEILGTEVVPQIRSCREIERLGLGLLVLGFYGSAHRAAGDIDIALMSLKHAANWAQEKGLEALRAELLRRTSYVMGERGEAALGLSLLNEALLTFVDLGLEVEVAKVMTARGSMFHQLGEFDAAELVLNQALKKLPTDRLPWDNQAPNIYRLAALQLLSRVATARGDVQAAERFQAESQTTATGQSRLVKAQLAWNTGWIAFGQGDLATALACLQEALPAHRDQGGHNFALLSLDRARVYLAAGQPKQALEAAREVAFLLRGAKKTKLLEAAALEFLRTVVDGHLEMAHLNGLEVKLAEQGIRRPAK